MTNFKFSKTHLEDKQFKSKRRKKKIVLPPKEKLFDHPFSTAVELYEQAQADFQIGELVSTPFGTARIVDLDLRGSVRVKLRSGLVKAVTPMVIQKKRT